MAKKKSYNKMYNLEDQEHIVSDEAVTDTAEVESQIEPTGHEEVPAFVMGVVVDCARLNIRTQPSIDAEVLCELPRSSEVQVDRNSDHKDWYHVRAASGIDGYCMKQFIKAKP